MVMLGIDPGFVASGFAILKKEGGKVLLMECQYLKMYSTQSLPERVAQFHSFFTQKIQQHAVTHLSLETPFLGKNAQNFLKLGYLRGIMYLLAHTHGLVLQEFAPTQVKQSVTGFGGAAKDQVARLLYQLFPGLPKQEKADITDALAVALCGVWQLKPVVQQKPKVILQG